MILTGVEMIHSLAGFGNRFVASLGDKLHVHALHIDGPLLLRTWRRSAVVPSCISVLPVRRPLAHYE